jgi:hypothetical protein
MLIEIYWVVSDSESIVIVIDTPHLGLYVNLHPEPPHFVTNLGEI